MIGCSFEQDNINLYNVSCSMPNWNTVNKLLLRDIEGGIPLTKTSLSANWRQETYTF